MANGYGQVDGPSKAASDIQERTLNQLGAMQAKSSPPMDVSMRGLGQSIERLAMVVQTLAGKLEPVMYPEPPSPTTTGVQAVDTRGPRASSNLGSTVNSFADQIDGLTDRVNSMIRRCEL